MKLVALQKLMSEIQDIPPDESTWFKDHDSNFYAVYAKSNWIYQGKWKLITHEGYASEIFKGVYLCLEVDKDAVPDVQEMFQPIEMMDIEKIVDHIKERTSAGIFSCLSVSDVGDTCTKSSTWGEWSRQFGMLKILEIQMTEQLKAR